MKLLPRTQLKAITKTFRQLTTKEPLIRQEKCAKISPLPDNKSECRDQTKVKFCGIRAKKPCSPGRTKDGINDVRLELTSQVKERILKTQAPEKTERAIISKGALASD